MLPIRQTLLKKGKEKEKKKERGHIYYYCINNFMGGK